MIHLKKLLNTFGLLLLSFTFIAAQPSSSNTSQNDKAEQIIQKAIEKLGGSRYLSVRTAISKGLYTQYKEGVYQVTSPFLDYITYPDKERTEFRLRGARSIQTNVGNTGWIYDGSGRTIKEMDAEQIKDFRDYTLRTSVESLLRGFWKKENAKLEYVGKREATLGRRNEVLRLIYPDGFIVEYEFSYEGLPSKIIFKRKVEKQEEDDSSEEENKDAKTEDPNSVKEEIRLAQFVEVGGVFTPFVIDTYQDGKQTARVNFESVEFNKDIPESLFVKPANIKDIK